MSHAAHTAVSAASPGLRPGRRAVFLILGLAFMAGLGAVFLLRHGTGTSYTAVYRQEAVAVRIVQPGVLRQTVAASGTAVVPGDTLAILEDSTASARAITLAETRDRLRREIDQAAARVAVELAQRTATLEKDRLDLRLRCADLLRARFAAGVRKRALEETPARVPSVAEGGPRLTPVALQTMLNTSTLATSTLATAATERRIELADITNEEQVLATQVALCEDRLGEIERLLLSLPAQVQRAAGLDRLQADAAAADADLATATAAEAVVLTSAFYGRIGVYRKQPGEYAAAGTTLVEIFDAERPWLLLTVPIAELPRFGVGQSVRVEFTGVSTRKPLQGRVVSHRSEAEIDGDAIAAPGAATAAIRIEPAGRLWPTLPPGSTATLRLLD